jgi:hypothetical protein
MLTSTTRFGLAVAFTPAAFASAAFIGAAVAIVCDEPGTIISAIKLRKMSAFSPAFFSCRRLISRIVATSLLTFANRNGNVDSVHMLLKEKTYKLRSSAGACAGQHAVS